MDECSITSPCETALPEGSFGEQGRLSALLSPGETEHYGEVSCCQHLYICSTSTEKHIRPGWEEKLKSWNKNSIFKGLISVLFLVIAALH